MNRLLEWLIPTTLCCLLSLGPRIDFLQADQHAEQSGHAGGHTRLL